MIQPIQPNYDSLGTLESTDESKLLYAAALTEANMLSPKPQASSEPLDSDDELRLSKSLQNISLEQQPENNSYVTCLQKTTKAIAGLFSKYPTADGIYVKKNNETQFSIFAQPNKKIAYILTKTKISETVFSGTEKIGKFVIKLCYDQENILAKVKSDIAIQFVNHDTQTITETEIKYALHYGEYVGFAPLECAFSYQKYKKGSQEKIDKQSLIYELFNGDCKQLLDDTAANNVSISIEDKFSIIYQIAKAINKLHSEEYVHGDIKLENIVYRYIKEEANEVPIIEAALTDFEHMVSKKSNSFLKSDWQKYGTAAFYAPELLHQFIQKESAIQVNIDDKALDMYALGVSLYELLFFSDETDMLDDIELLFPHSTATQEQREDIYKNVIDFLAKVHKKLEELENLMNNEKKEHTLENWILRLTYKLLQNDNNKRPNSQEVLVFLNCLKNDFKLSKYLPENL